MVDPELVSRCLERLRQGEDGAVDDLLPLVYADLKALAGRAFGDQPRDHTLQPTALVHEAYMRLANSEGGYEGRRHFLAVAAMAMRQILGDHARRRLADKRGGDRRRVTLSEAWRADGLPEDVDLVALDAALSRLQELDERQARIVELRFFGGLSPDEVADVLGVSSRTVFLDWKMARAWLRAEIDRELAS